MISFSPSEALLMRYTDVASSASTSLSGQNVRAIVFANLCKKQLNSATDFFEIENNRMMIENRITFQRFLISLKQHSQFKSSRTKLSRNTGAPNSLFDFDCFHRCFVSRTVPFKVTILNVRQGNTLNGTVLCVLETKWPVHGLC